MSSHASHMHVSDRCRYWTRVEMWVNLRAILVTSGRQSDNKPVSSWTSKKTIKEQVKKKKKLGYSRRKCETKPCPPSHLNVADLWVAVSRPVLCDDWQRLEITGQTQTATCSWNLQNIIQLSVPQLNFTLLSCIICCASRKSFASSVVASDVSKIHQLLAFLIWKYSSICSKTVMNDNAVGNQPTTAMWFKSFVSFYCSFVRLKLTYDCLSEDVEDTKRVSLTPPRVAILYIPYA